MLWKTIKEDLLKHKNQLICEKDTNITFEDLVSFAEMFSQKIANKKCCAILCNSEMAASMALLSCFAAGVTAVPLSTRYGDLHCKKILDFISPDTLITDTDGELKPISLENSKYQKPIKHPALIMCTSGTTGQPKGVMLSKENILTNVKDISSYFEIDSNDSILISRPLYHCAVLTGEFLTAIRKGVKIHFYSQNFNPLLLIDIIKENNITTFCGTPTLINMLARFKRKTPNLYLKNICVSGECMSQKIADNINAAFSNTNIYHVYGLTEACPRVCYLPPRLFKDYPCSVGFTLDSISYKIITQSNEMAGINEEGIFWIKGKNIMLGYYKDPQLTKKVLKNGWLCTGDIAVLNDHGLIEIKGRKDDLIIRAGMNIYPQEIESTLKTDDRVREVLVYKYDSKLNGIEIGMKISGDFSSVDEIQKLCNKILPTYQMPSRIELLDELKKNASGKIIRGVQND